MNDDSLEQIERQLAALPTSGAPRELREAVLAGVRRELRAARWDRRVARAAAVLFVVGLGLNLSVGARHADLRSGRTGIAKASSQSLMDTALVVAEATDAATARRFARHLAAMAGVELTGAEAAAIDAALEQAAPHTTENGNRG